MSKEDAEGVSGCDRELPLGAEEREREESWPCAVVAESEGIEGEGGAGRRWPGARRFLPSPAPGVGGVTIGSPLSRGELGTVLDTESIVGARERDSEEKEPSPRSVVSPDRSVPSLLKPSQLADKEPGKAVGALALGNSTRPV
jgi:hypothetical protein